MKILKITFALLVLFVSNLTAQNLSIQIEVQGKGTPVLFLPGFTCTGEVWKETVEEISSTHECHIVNYPGFGTVPAIDTLWLKSIEKDLITYIQQKKLTNVSMVGHSMGGTLALNLAIHLPEAISNLLIVDALPCMGAMMIPNYSPEKVQYNTAYNQNLLKMSEDDFAAMASNFVKFMCMNPQKQKQIEEWMKLSDRKTYAYGYTDLLRVDLRKELSKIKARVKILAAAFPNKAMVEQNYTMQYAELEQKEIVYIEKSAHFIMYDNYNAYIQHVKQVLSPSSNESNAKL